jgi:SAM-dependent methyltransferase
MHFYEVVIRKVGIPLDDSILVVCGSGDDGAILQSIGFRNVTISNLDDRANGVEPYKWAHQDAEQLTFTDASFDWVIVHSGLHHCGSPHKALIEMYRVCRKGLIAMEARDSLLMRLSVALGQTPQFENISIAINGYGGLRNGPLPNFIYRWTEREVRKTIETAAPHHEHDVRFFYRLDVPNYRLVMLSPVKRALGWTLAHAAKVVGFLLPRQGNRFGFCIRKTGRFKPWMDATGERVRSDYALGYDPTKYRGML